jgi:hypothetical protein
VPNRAPRWTNEFARELRAAPTHRKCDHAELLRVIRLLEIARPA